MTNIHTIPHSKRYVFGVAVMALATFRQSRAQQPAQGTQVSSLAELANRASALGAAGRYDEQLATLEEATAILVNAMPQHPEPAARQAEVDALTDLGLRLDGAGRSSDAVHVLQQSIPLATDSPSRFVAQLALAHAQAAAGDAAAAQQTCALVDPSSISATDRRRHLLGTAATLRAQKELFCGDPEKGRAMLNDELSRHPQMAYPHQIFCEYDLATHNWSSAARECALWQNSPEIRAARTQ